MEKLWIWLPAASLAVLFAFIAGCGGDGDGGNAGPEPVPAEIQGIFDKPAYRNGSWALRVVDLDSGRIIHDVNSGRPRLIASVRKLFSVGVALETLGADHVFRTAVHRQGTVSGTGVLAGDLILVASGDMAMGARTNADGTFAISRFDHNEANALGNAELTMPDPLAGYNALALQVAAAGIRSVSGQVVIDDRLFEPFDFRGEFLLRPIFVNDDVVDVLIDGQAAVDWRPRSTAFSVESSLVKGSAGSALDIDLEPELPQCIGSAPCIGHVSGTLPDGFVPPFTGQYPLIRTFRITQPSNYARTVFIEALARAGVTVAAPAVAPNPVQVLPTRNSYTAATRVAELVSHPYKEHAKLVLKVSYNLGADLSLMLFGVSQGVTTEAAALAAEQNFLATRFGIPASELNFVDGSGGGDTTATNEAVIAMLVGMSTRPSYAAYLDSQPRLGIDGSLSFVTDFAADPSLAGAKGQVRAKTGTYVTGDAQGRPVIRSQALAGYIDAKSGRRLAFVLTVNDAGVISSIDDVLPVFQDEGTISAMLWKLH